MMQGAVMSTSVQSPTQLATMRFALRVETFTKTSVLKKYNYALQLLQNAY